MIAIIHKIREYTTYLVAVYFLFPVLWASYLIGLWAVFCLATAIVQWKHIGRADLRNIVLYISPFVLLLASIAWHGGNGAGVLERGLSFLIFPLCVFLSSFKINKQELMNLTWVFVVGCFALALKGLFMYLLVESYYQYDSQHDLIFKYRQEFNANTKIAPTYASIYFAFALILVLLQLNDIKKKKVILLTLSGSVFLNLIFLSAKMPMLAFGIVFILLLIRKQVFMKLGNASRWGTVMVLAVLTVVSLFLFTRWSELFTGVSYQTNAETENSVGIRKGIFKCAMDLSGEYYLLGVGPQHLQKKLNECYYQFEGNDFDRHQFNTHNQYFDSLLSSGIIGLLVLLMVLIVPLYYSIQLKDPFLFSFIVLIGICMLTENILNRQAGIVFYAFFNAILVNRNKEGVFDA